MPAIFIIRECADIEAVNAISMKLRAADGAQVLISISKVTKAAKITAVTAHMEHFGVVLENDFRVTGGGTFKYMLVHALQQTNDKNKIKLDVVLSNAKPEIEQRMNLVRGKVKREEFEPVLLRSTEELEKMVHEIVVRKFTPLSTSSARLLAMQEYDEYANCTIAAIKLHALLFKQDPDTEVERYFASRRGELLRRAGVNIDDEHEGIPCSDIAFWTTLEEKIAANGDTVRLQEHKLESDYVTSFRRIVRWSIHAKKFRVIVQAKDARMWTWRWRDVARSDDKGEMEAAFARFVSN